MKIFKPMLFSILLIFAWVAPQAALAQALVQPNSNHEKLLASDDPALRANKRLVYDFWREVFESGQIAAADKYIVESYIQHNPYVPSGRAAFTGFLARRVPTPKAIEQRVQAPLVAITAEGDLVILSFLRELPEPKDATKKYTTTWFDMFRIENGMIAEHWDGAIKQ